MYGQVDIGFMTIKAIGIQSGISRGKEIMSKKVELNIKATLDERWVNDFCSMLNWMQRCGELGHSSVVAFYSDGDGDFRPKFEFDGEYEKTKGYWARDGKPLPEIEVIYDAG